MAKKVKKEKKKRLFSNFLSKVAFVSFVIICGASIISDQVTISEKKQQLAQLEAKEEQLTEENQQYSRLLDYDDERAYMESLAIDKLNYAYPTERRFYDTSRD